MRKLFVFLFVVLILQQKLTAQVDSVRLELDYIFHLIDKSQVPSGYLDEYGAQFVEKKWYNGVLTDSNRIAQITGFRFLYNDIEQSRIYTSAPAMTPLDTVNAIIDNLPDTNYTPLIFLIGKYATLREDALALNLFYNMGNTHIADVPGRTTSPYIQNNFFAACPVKTDAVKTGTIRLRYDPALAFTNAGKTISTVAVDFLNGSGYQTVDAGNTISHTYTDSSGYKQFVIKVTCTDASVYYTYSQQYVKVSTGIGARYESLTTIELANPNFTIAKTGQHEEAKVYIRYSSARNGTALQGQLVKPFIVVEGYDLHDAAPSLGKKENNSINSLFEEWNTLAEESNYDLNQALDEDGGYDLVFVDYHTMDYIENNAIMLEKVIDQVNLLKVNNALNIREKNVIMGISLGGVLSRYTLAKMTKTRGTNSTDTRQLFTYDSPHQGGNVPLGFQHFLQDFGEVPILGKKIKTQVDQLKEFYNLNAQPATGQLLLYKVENGTSTVTNNTFFAVGGPYRTMVDFSPSQLISTPPLYEFKAIAQGSQCGVQVMEPGTSLIDVRTDLAEAYFLGGTVISNKNRVTVKINALPVQGAGTQISYVKSERNIKIFSAIGTGWKTTYNSTPRYAPINAFPWDGVPGGTSSATSRSGGKFGAHTLMPDVGHTMLADFVDFHIYSHFFALESNLNLFFSQDVFTTVPINSALDIQGTTATTLNRSHIFPIDGRANSTAIKYIANESFPGSVNNAPTTLYNYEHADFTKRQAEWMYNEMQNSPNNTLDCLASSECISSTTFSISGDNSFCTTSNPYTIANLPVGATVTWSAVPVGVVTINTPNALQTTITKINSANFSLTATITTACGGSPIVITKNNIYTGTPMINQLVGSASYLTYEDPLEMEINQICNLASTTVSLSSQGGGSITWSKISSNPNPVTWHQSGSNLNFYLYLIGQQATFKATSTNGCGTTSKYFSFQSISCGGGGGPDPDPCGEINAYPNPANNVINLIPPPCLDPPVLDARQTNPNGIKKSSIEQVILYDITGARLIEKKYTYNSKATSDIIQLDVSGIKSGIYILEVVTKGIKKQKRIIINK